MNSETALLHYTLQMADNALIIGHRISEWCGHGPILEQDIAITNTSLDHIGQARSLYQYAADIYSAMPEEDRDGIFNSPMLANTLATKGRIDEDDLAYLRDAWDFRNVLLVEQPNEDWAYTIARSFFYDAFQYFFYSALQQSKNEAIAAIAEKSLKEATYHLRWSSEWVIRLGDGTEESNLRMQEAIDERWAFTGEMFNASEADNAALNAGYGVDLSAIRSQWQHRIDTVLEEATLTKPANTWMQSGGKVGTHTEHLGYVLAEMQYMQRAYPGMEW